MFRDPLEEQGEEGLFAPRALRLSQKKALSVHYVPTTSARTPVAHRVQERVACPSWGAPPHGPKTWVMEVVEMTEVKKGQGGQGGQNQPANGRKCYITPAFLGIPKERGTKSELDA